MKGLARLFTGGNRRIVGLMSGTSADGVDVALVDLEPAPGSKLLYSWELVNFLTLPYGDAVRAEILAVQEGGPQILERATRLHFVLGTLFADAVEKVVADSGHVLTAVDLIASHGQTVCHFPSISTDAGLPGSEAWGRRDGAGLWVSPSTLQLGEPAVMAERTGIAVMSNFRSRDVAAGGTGAPLVPLVDHLLYAEPDKNRLALNIGGIANVTALPAGCSAEAVVAFDTGPGNMVSDALMTRLTHREQHFDQGGGMARKGKPSVAVVERFLAEPFFQQPPPRAAGRGEFGEAFAVRFQDACAEQKLSQASMMATAAALTTYAVRQACRQHLQFEPDEIIVSGGGAHNVAMLEQLTDLFPQGKVVTSDYYGLDVDAKEALAFALLANLSLDGRPGSLPGVTGARHPVILGSLTPGGRS